MIEEDRGKLVGGICKGAFMVPGQESKAKKGSENMYVCVCWGE